MKKRHGFTLIEILMATLLIAIISVLSIEVVGGSVDEARFEDTLAEMKQIRDAIIGNPDLKEGGTRNSFGFLGDIGAIPSAVQGIAALVTNPGLAVWAVNTTGRFGIGWNGPYLGGGDSGSDYTTDAWGTAYVYSPAASPATLVSRGSDAAVGGTGYAQDITVTIPTELKTATVTGYISLDGGPFAALAEVELNYASGTGTLTQTIDPITVPEAGKFSFANVPQGVRSLTVYRPDKATATAGNTLGPFIIVVDKPNYFVAPNLTDF
jgi:prepilin-type N-terminal cleavage/methylation domain-containing protein